MGIEGPETLDRKYGNMGSVKTTLDLPDDLFRQAKAKAALRGQSLKALVTEALAAHLASPDGVEPSPPWRAFFGRATPDQVSEVDSFVEADLGRVEPDAWD